MRRIAVALAVLAACYLLSGPNTAEAAPGASQIHLAVGGSSHGSHAVVPVVHHGPSYGHRPSYGHGTSYGHRPSYGHSAYRYVPRPVPCYHSPYPSHSYSYRSYPYRSYPYRSYPSRPYDSYRHSPYYGGHGQIGVYGSRLGISIGF